VNTEHSHGSVVDPGFAVALIEHTAWGEAIAKYINLVQATFEPFGGRFRVHGGRIEVVEGDYRGHVVIVEFPSLPHARRWYQSPAYQDILHLRADNTRGALFLVEGVSEGYRAHAQHDVESHDNS
jgi:uncharacterized protein (DUF1330 family)